MIGELLEVNLDQVFSLVNKDGACLCAWVLCWCGMSMQVHVYLCAVYVTMGLLLYLCT